MQHTNKTQAFTAQKVSPQKAHTLIVTDLDGTLLDHHTYSWQAAKPAIAQARIDNIPIIPCTSKTLHETQKLTADMNLTGPIIFENGSGIALSPNKIIDLAPHYNDLLAALEAIKCRHGFRFTGFSAMNVADIAQHTQLSLEDASDAKKRRYSEPFLWQDKPSSLTSFEALCRSANIDIVQGGRFYHALSRGVSKQHAIEQLKQELNMPNAHIIALGDSNNDIAMLSQADTAIVVNNPTRHFPVLSHNQNNVHYTSAYGPLGWNDAIISQLKTMENTHG
ncbi:HAD-IIB family hydrolase [Marinagarivorans algicola]|uniref:HAD-IIB family hydrolase n=1 Tax=Marinagarivorans algicola TaxID=1513270 RepID=UPI0006B6796F|nr:HAD-IIB family hydrolase [Marinagarivorans algicola]